MFGWQVPGTLLGIFPRSSNSLSPGFSGKQFLPGQYSSEINQAAQEIRGGDPVPAEGCDPLFGPERMEEEPEQGRINYRNPE